MIRVNLKKYGNKLFQFYSNINKIYKLNKNKIFEK